MSYGNHIRRLKRRIIGVTLYQSCAYVLNKNGCYADSLALVDSYLETIYSWIDEEIYGARRTKVGVVNELPLTVPLAEAPELPTIFHGPEHLADRHVDADDGGSLARLALEP